MPDKRKFLRRFFIPLLLLTAAGLFGCQAAFGALQAQTTEVAPTGDAPADLLDNPQAGVVITTVQADSPADQLGLWKGDVILRVGDEAVNSIEDLLDAFTAYESGDRVELTLRRGEQVFRETVELEEPQNLGALGVTLCCGPGFMPRAGFLFEGNAGALVLEVEADSPAAEAGLASGDMILSVDGETLGPELELRAAIQARQPGDEIALEIQRDGENLEQSVTLAASAEDESLAYLGVRYRMLPAWPDELNIPELRFRFDPQNLPDVLPFDLPFAEPFGLRPLLRGDMSGILVLEVFADSPAAAAGLQRRDVITTLDGEAITSMDAFQSTIAEHQPGDQVSLTVARPGETGLLELQVTLAENPENEGVGYLGIRHGGFIHTETRDDCEGEECPEIFEHEFRVDPEPGLRRRFDKT